MSAETSADECELLCMRTMARSLVSDVPQQLFQAVLQHLDHEDVANLLLVNHSVSRLTKQHISSVLRLSDTTTTHELQQWCQATRLLHQVAIIHLHITTDIPAEVFEPALQLLSQHASITKLCILAAPVEADDTSTYQRRSIIPTLQPLMYLLPRLHTLVIEGVGVQNLAEDLQQLAAAAPSETGWLLRSLQIQFYGCSIDGVPWLEFRSALLHLSDAFPHLRTLSMQLPSMGPRDIIRARDLVNYQVVTPGVAVAMAMDTIFSTALGRSYVPPGCAEKYWRELHLSDFAGLAVLAYAVQRLKFLEVLTVTEVPDVCDPCYVCLIAENILSHTEQSSLAGVPVKVRMAAVVDAMVHSGLLPPTASAAAMNFQCFDSYGSWILQQHPTLHELHLSTVDRTWIPDRAAMSWRKQQQLQMSRILNNSMFGNHPACSSSRPSADCVDLDGIKWCVDYVRYKYGVPREDPGITPDISSQFVDTLAGLYSSRPAPVLMQHISSCQLQLHKAKVGGLPGLTELLDGLKSLKHLQITLPAFTTAVVAAALVGHTNILSLELEYCHNYGAWVSDLGELPDDLLLPLTVSAGGPGSILRKLQLDGAFLTDRTGTMSTTTQERRSRLAGLVPGWGNPWLYCIVLYCIVLFLDAAAAGAERVYCNWDLRVPNPQWHHTLRRFHHLHELVVYPRPEPLSELPVASLPATLNVLRGKWLNITGEAIRTGHSNDFNTNPFWTNPSDDSNLSVGKHSGPMLQKLESHYSNLSSPSILASHRLKQLILFKTSFPGGCSAAATAWPSVRRLVWLWQPPSLLKSMSISHTSLTTDEVEVQQCYGPCNIAPVTCCYCCDQVFNEQIVAAVRHKFRCLTSVVAKGVHRHRYS